MIKLTSQFILFFKLDFYENSQKELLINCPKLSSKRSETKAFKQKKTRFESQTQFEKILSFIKWTLKW